MPAICVGDGLANQLQTDHVGGAGTPAGLTDDGPWCIDSRPGVIEPIDFLRRLTGLFMLAGRV
jgi:hypothetical protein